MQRKDFLRTCGFACLGGILITSFLEGCNSSKIIAGTLNNADLILPISAFINNKGSFRKYVVVQHEKLKYPVCVYRFSEVKYTALLMRCTHQGTELQVFGDKLECPAHGSEFNNRGQVQNGPADSDLRTFTVSIHDDQLYILLK